MSVPWSLLVCIQSFMAEGTGIILLNDKFIHSGNLSGLQFGMLRLHFQEQTIIVMYKKKMQFVLTVPFLSRAEQPRKIKKWVRFPEG